MTIDTSYFQGDLSIGQITSDANAAAMNLFIEKYEERFLTELLGYELYTQYRTGIVAGSPLQKWLDIRDGKEYTNEAGVLTKWRGLRFSAGVITNTVTFIDPITFKIGDGGSNTPAAGATSYINSDLAGASIVLFRAGSIKYPVQDYTVRAGGGFDLIGADIFGNEEEFMIFINSPVVNSSVDSGSLKQSPIANYVYFHYLKDNVTFTMGEGEVKAKPATSEKVSPYPKMVRAWNEMVNWNWELVNFLNFYDDVYPTYVNYGIPEEILKYKNTLGL